MDTSYSLRVLAKVARHNSFSGAARDMSVSTSTIMRVMDALEHRVEVPLLTRTTRRIDLTEAGHRLLAGSLPHVEEIEALVRDLRDSDAQPAGQLRITSAFSFGRSVLTEIVRDFLEQHPNIGIDLMLTDGIIDLDENNIDAAIRISDSGQSPDLVVHELRPMQRYVCASPVYIARHGRPQRPDDLKRHSCLLFRPAVRRDPWAPITDKWTFVKRGHEPRTIEVKGKVSGNDADALVAAARDALGVIMMPDWLVADDIADGRLNRLLAGFEAIWRGAPKMLHIAYPQHRRSSRRVQAFVAHVRRHFRNAPRA